MLFVTGYSFAALAYYANHRWIFHGTPRGPQWLKSLWRTYSRYHMRHHSKWRQEDPETKRWLEHFPHKHYRRLRFMLLKPQGRIETHNDSKMLAFY